jgi:hypothetical protein
MWQRKFGLQTQISRWIKIKEIKSAKVFRDEKRTYCIEYKNLFGDNTLWKSLKKNDSAAIYNDLIFLLKNI